jgi:antitoxin VapB
MALNIANKRVEEKAITASRLINVNKTAAVEIALDYYLSHHTLKQKKQVTNLEVNRLLDELSALPVLDPRSMDDIIGYDENGLV